MSWTEALFIIHLWTPQPHLRRIFFYEKKVGKTGDVATFDDGRLDEYEKITNKIFIWSAFNARVPCRSVVKLQHVAISCSLQLVARLSWLTVWSDRNILRNNSWWLLRRKTCTRKGTLKVVDCVSNLSIRALVFWEGRRTTASIVTTPNRSLFRLLLRSLLI